MERKWLPSAVFLGLAILAGLAILSFRTLGANQAIPLCLMIIGIVLGVVWLVGMLSSRPHEVWRLDDPHKPDPDRPAILPMQRNFPRKPG